MFQMEIRVPFLQSHLWYSFKLSRSFFGKRKWFVQMVKATSGRNLPVLDFPLACITSHVIIEANKRRFWATDVNRKWTSWILWQFFCPIGPIVVLSVDLLGSKRLCLSFLMHRNIPRHSSLICYYFMWKVPQMLEICLVPITSVASQYPGLYIFSTPARMMRPVLNLAASKVEMIGTFEQVRGCSNINCFTLNLNSCSY